jgi:ABC-2 type transport system permease protein
MNLTFTIARHEFKSMTRRRGFVIMTLLFPLLALLGITVAQFILAAPDDPADLRTIGYLAPIGSFTDNRTSESTISLVRYPDETTVRAALLGEDIDEYIVIPEDYLDTGIVTRYTLSREVEIPNGVYRSIRQILLANLLADKVDESIINRTQWPLSLDTVTLDATGAVATEQGGFRGFILPYIFSFLLVISILSSSGHLLQSVAEEKESRIMEVLLSSVSPRELLAGKVLGLGLGGLVQIVVWLVAAQLLVGLALSSLGGIAEGLYIPPNLIALGVVYFLLGYLLFATLMAVVGSIGNAARESQQISMIFIIPAMLPFYFMWLLVTDPSHVIGRVFTLIPLTAPVMVMVRLGISGIPAWELAVSITLMVISIALTLIFGARIFRTYLLMYGKRPGLREIFRNLRQS